MRLQDEDNDKNGDGGGALELVQCECNDVNDSLGVEKNAEVVETVNPLHHYVGAQDEAEAPPTVLETMNPLFSDKTPEDSLS